MYFFNCYGSDFFTHNHLPDDYYADKSAVPLFQTPVTNTEGKQMQLN